MIRYSTETLYHFKCGTCEHWWTIVDWEHTKTMKCFHCGLHSVVGEERLLPSDSVNELLKNPEVMKAAVDVWKEKVDPDTDWAKLFKEFVDGRNKPSDEQIKAAVEQALKRSVESTVDYSDFVGMVKSPKDLIDRCERGDSIPIPDEFFGAMRFNKDGTYVDPTDHRMLDDDPEFQEIVDELRENGK